MPIHLLILVLPSLYFLFYFQWLLCQILNRSLCFYMRCLMRYYFEQSLFFNLDLLIQIFKIGLKCPLLFLFQVYSLNNFVVRPKGGLGVIKLLFMLFLLPYGLPFLLNIRYPFLLQSFR